MMGTIGCSRKNVSCEERQITPKGTFFLGHLVYLAQSSLVTKTFILSNSSIKLNANTLHKMNLSSSLIWIKSHGGFIKERSLKQWGLIFCSRQNKYFSLFLYSNVCKQTSGKT